MAHNIEIKAAVADLAALEQSVRPLATAGPTLIAQDDCFFTCPHGRLKLRAFSANAGELIFYQRPDQAGPKTSFYLRTPTADPNGLREALTQAYGQTGRVIKQRTLYMIGRTRVHLDQVEGLGSFMELEVVLAEHEAQQTGVEEARHIMTQLGIRQENLIEEAYVDLLNRS